MQAFSRIQVKSRNILDRTTTHYETPDIRIEIKKKKKKNVRNKKQNVGQGKTNRVLPLKYVIFHCFTISDSKTEDLIISETDYLILSFSVGTFHI